MGSAERAEAATDGRAEIAAKPKTKKLIEIEESHVRHRKSISTSIH
jgi:hypothetical protein